MRGRQADHHESRGGGTVSVSGWMRSSHINNPLAGLGRARRNSQLEGWNTDWPFGLKGLAVRGAGSLRFRFGITTSRAASSRRHAFMRDDGFVAAFYRRPEAGCLTTRQLNPI